MTVKPVDFMYTATKLVGCIHMNMYLFSYFRQFHFKAAFDFNPTGEACDLGHITKAFELNGGNQVAGLDVVKLQC